MKEEEQVSATPSYLKLTLETSVTLRNKQLQLLILDLNGTLCSRSSLTAFTARPHARKFFEYVFTNFTVMVWSSAQNYSVKKMCEMFEPYKPQTVWDRSHLGLAPADYNSNVETVKDLEKVWEKLPNFNPTNTIVLDDSASKLALQPYNLIKMSTFDYEEFMKSNTGERDLLKVIKYLGTLQFQSNVANYMRFDPFDVNQDYGIAPNEKEDKCLLKFAKGTGLINQQLVVGKKVKNKWTREQKKEAALKRAADPNYDLSRRFPLKKSIKTIPDKQPIITRNKNLVIRQDQLPVVHQSQQPVIHPVTENLNQKKPKLNTMVILPNPLKPFYDQKFGSKDSK